jgi:hypothetical protein
MLLPLNDAGDLQPGLHKASLEYVLFRFGTGSAARRRVASRLERVHSLAMATGEVRRFIVFGSFITAKENPNDVDVFMIMEDAFDFRAQRGEARLLFEHPSAQAHFGASVFWVRRLAALTGEDAAILDWETKRDGGQRELVEIEVNHND